VIGDGAQPFGPVDRDIGERAHQHAEVAPERFDRPDALLWHGQTVQRRLAFVTLIHDAHDRPWQERQQFVAHGHRPAARPAAAVRRAEGLVQVVVHHIEAQIARFGDAEHGIHVRAVHIHQAAAAMNDVHDILDMALEHAQRVGHRDHHAGHVLAAHLAQLVEVHIAVVVGRHLDDL